METSDPVLPARVPSPVEIVGIIAGAAPFMVSMASTSMETVNGHVTAFTYRDPVAIAGGIVAAVCGVFALTLLGKTEPSKRTLRIILCIALIGGGAFQALKGFGIVGVDKPDTQDVTMQTAGPMPPPEPAKPAVDEKGVTAMAQNIVALWSANKVDAIYALAQPEAAKDFDVFDLKHIHDTFAESFGAFEKIGPLQITEEDGVIHAQGPAVFTKATLVFKLALVRNAASYQWRGLTLDIPKELQKEPDPVDGDAFARKVVDTVLSKKFEWALFHPRLVDHTPPDIQAQLDGLLAKLGPIKKIGEPVPRECEETRCVDFPIQAKKGKGTFAVDLQYTGYAWRATRWNLTPE